MLAPKDFTPAMLGRLAQEGYDWQPERRPEGPITTVVSSSDRAIYVYRNGNPIGRAALEISGGGLTRRGRLGSATSHAKIQPICLITRMRNTIKGRFAYALLCRSRFGLPFVISSLPSLIGIETI